MGAFLPPYRQEVGSTTYDVKGIHVGGGRFVGPLSWTHCRNLWPGPTEGRVKHEDSIRKSNVRTGCPRAHFTQRLGFGAVWVGTLIISALATPHPGGAQDLALISGRLFDRQSQEAIADATVELDGTTYAAVSNEDGIFRIAGVPGGVYVVRVTHLAYGTHEQSMNVPEGSEMAVRIAMSVAAIALDPVVVESVSQRERRDRGRGVRINELTVDEIEALIPTSRNLADVLQQSIPSLRSVPSSIANGRNCIEFRNPATLRHINECRAPLTFLDGIRMYDPPLLFSTIQLSSINRLELIPPAEAGAEYGSDSSFGVLLIETKSYATERLRVTGEPGGLPAGLESSWDWDLEGSKHPTAKVFLYSFLGNAAGLAAGLMAAEQCMEFDRLAVDIFNSSCGSWGTFGARSSAVIMPVAGAAVTARLAGRTQFSHGRFWPTALAAGVALLPGYAIASSSTVDGFQGTRWISRAVLLLGVPAASTLADYMYRRFSGAN